MEKSDIVFKSSLWEDDEHIISALPKGVEPWMDAPVGMTVSKQEGPIVARWLNRNWTELFKTLKNAEKHLAKADTNE